MDSGTNDVVSRTFSESFQLWIVYTTSDHFT